MGLVVGLWELWSSATNKEEWWCGRDLGPGFGTRLWMPLWIVHFSFTVSANISSLHLHYLWLYCIFQIPSIYIICNYVCLYIHKLGFTKLMKFWIVDVLKHHIYQWTIYYKHVYIFYRHAYNIFYQNFNASWTLIHFNNQKVNLNLWDLLLDISKILWGIL